MISRRPAGPTTESATGGDDTTPRREGAEEPTMEIRFPGESAGYRAARDELLAQEIALRRATEAMARARPALPPGGVVSRDSVFQAAGPTGVRMPELFAPGKDSLVVYHMMFPRS